MAGVRAGEGCESRVATAELSSVADDPAAHDLLLRRGERFARGENPDLPVSAAQERAECPVDDADDDLAEECIPETADVEARHELASEPEKERIQDEDEKTERDEDERDA